MTPYTDTPRETRTTPNSWFAAFKTNHRRHQLSSKETKLFTSKAQRRRKTPTLKLQLNYVPLSNIRKSRAIWDLDFDNCPVLLSLMVQFQKRSREVSHQSKVNMENLKADECRKKFRKRKSVDIGLRTKRRVDRADSFTECIQDADKKTLPILAPRKKITFASAKTNPRAVLYV
ncbi:hypothetical protein RB195_021972 [Necator americanus]|uniref:HTH CENPB-type domain-containing protein n=1 Tax=Necator americanus TaxID=51031 RepID=A0ABR1EDI5_NECAM